MMRVKRQTRTVLIVGLLAVSLISALAPLDGAARARWTPARIKTDLASLFNPLTMLSFRAGTALRRFAAGLAGGKTASERDRLGDRITELEGQVEKLRYELDVERRRRLSLETYRGKFPGGVISARVAHEGGLSARVMGAEPGVHHTSFRIDRGRVHGVEPGQGVLWHDTVVGRIRSVGRVASVVELVTDPDFRAKVRVGPKRVESVLEGSLAHSCRAKYVGAGEKVKRGDVVVTTGEFGCFPPGALAGRVTNRPSPARDGFLEIVVTPPTQLGRLLSVVVKVSGQQRKRSGKGAS